LSGYGYTPYWLCDNCGPATLGNIFSASIDPIGGFSSSNGFRPIFTGDPQAPSGDRFFNPDAFGLPPAGADVLDNPKVARRNLLRGQEMLQVSFRKPNIPNSPQVMYANSFG
jgi:hypothetical protein